jgi:hypothetical protein
MAVSTSIKMLFSKCRLLDTGSPTIALSESEMYAILLLVCRDLGWQPSDVNLILPEAAIPTSDYFFLEPAWFSAHSNAPNLSSLLDALSEASTLEPDFALYFMNLCALHKRRLKFQKILSTQPKPTMDQIGPRGLLEFGVCNTDLLKNWLVWRKWLFDVDNRAGQETGYLFEPVLASCLGGESVGATHSPVKRLDDTGMPKNSGRQIDCYIGSENKAYEFKIRVTIAASGQGRFAEEMSFPQECKAAGLTPVLIVLDPTPSPRLQELKTQFLRHSGEVYIGEKAWQHLEDKAGRVMSLFIQKYIKPPLKSLDEFDTAQLDSLKFSWTSDQILIEAKGQQYQIQRDLPSNLD